MDAVTDSVFVPVMLIVFLVILSMLEHRKCTCQQDDGPDVRRPTWKDYGDE